MKPQIPVGQLLATFLLFGCTQHALEPVVQRDDRVERAYADGLTEPYVRFVERGRMHLRDGELILAESYFELAANQLLFERPNYEVWLELAETKCRLMKLKDGFELLDDFDAALKVEFGEALCFAAGGPETAEFKNLDLSDRVVFQMCGEMAGLLYSPDPRFSVVDRPENQSMKRRYKTDSAVLRARCIDVAHEPVHANTQYTIK